MSWSAASPHSSESRHVPPLLLERLGETAQAAVERPVIGEMSLETAPLKSPHSFASCDPDAKL
jgi:hypothetical protein